MPVSSPSKIRSKFSAPARGPHLKDWQHRPKTVRDQPPGLKSVLSALQDASFRALEMAGGDPGEALKAGLRRVYTSKPLKLNVLTEIIEY
jgi:hypothetical protein